MQHRERALKLQLGRNSVDVLVRHLDAHGTFVDTVLVEGILADETAVLFTILRDKL